MGDTLLVLYLPIVPVLTSHSVSVLSKPKIKLNVLFRRHLLLHGGVNLITWLLRWQVLWKCYSIKEGEAEPLTDVKSLVEGLTPAEFGNIINVKTLVLVLWKFTLCSSLRSAKPLWSVEHIPSGFYLLPLRKWLTLPAYSCSQKHSSAYPSQSSLQTFAGIVLWAAWATVTFAPCFAK